MEKLEYEILGCLYFVEPFNRVCEEVSASKPEIKDALRNLIGQHYVAAYVFNIRNNQFEQTAVYDTDNLESYCFSATQKGISLHNKGPHG
jgi:hypothetical protein